MIVTIFIINQSTISFIHICKIKDIDNHVDIDDLIHVADMDETYGTSVDDEYVDNHDYDDDTDDDT